MNENEENPRAANKKEICGVTRITGETEWICIRPPHNTQYKRKSTDARHQGYVENTGAHPERPWPNHYPPSEKHYMVNRWPGRKRE